MNKTPKPKTCRECKEKYIPKRILSPVCEKFECKVAYATKAAEKSAIARKKRETSALKERKEKLKSLTDYIHEAQRHFNAYVRYRDLAKGYGCISCGTMTCRLWSAGHFRTTKAAPQLRFNEDNVNLQCGWNCNVNQSGNIVEYRIELVRRIGVERVEALENNNDIHRYTIEEVKAITKKYKELTKQLKQSRE